MPSVDLAIDLDKVQWRVAAGVEGLASLRLCRVTAAFLQTGARGQSPLVRWIKPIIGKVGAQPEL